MVGASFCIHKSSARSFMVPKQILRPHNKAIKKRWADDAAQRLCRFK
ncbi:hypothetical protein HMPREF9061_00605 [Actinomyces sp. oral taxon 181 str. F0379]|nr:hypothetical protein HMPREF9061_00605 [Actinomyces sp. oral taxon 181 str. F0379]